MSAAERTGDVTEVLAPTANLAGVLQALPDLLSIIDADGCVEYISPASHHFLGLAPNLIVGQPACQFIVPDDRRNCAAWLAHAQLSSDVPGLVHRLRAPDGTTVVVESTLRPLSRENGRPRVLVASRDLSERALVDEQLNALAQVWSDVFDVMREGVLVVDSACTVLCANRAAGTMLGVQPRALPGSPLARYLEPGPGPNCEAATRFLRGTGAPPCGDVPCTARRSDVPAGGLHMTAMPLPGTSAGRRAVVLLGSVTTAAHATTSSAASLRALLSPREVEVLRLLADGHDVQAVSARLGISIHTTRNYVKSVLHKLDVRNQLQAVVVALRAGLFELS